VGAGQHPNARRSERVASRIPVTLLANSMGLEFEQPASTINLSKHGLRIQTLDSLSSARPVNPGQALYVLTSHGARLGYCRVVWVQAVESDRPVQAGLEFLAS